MFATLRMLCLIALALWLTIAAVQWGQDRAIHAGTTLNANASVCAQDGPIVALKNRQQVLDYLEACAYTSTNAGMK